MAYPSPRQLQLRRGNAAAVGSYTGLAGELTVNTSDWTLQVHDGVLPGGHAATVNTSTLTDQISSVNANITIANVGMKGYVDQGNTIQSQQIIAANLGLKGYIDLANTIQSAQITSANLGIIGYVNQGNTIQSAQISSANIGMRGYVDATIAANIANIAIASTYSNVNVRTYLGAFDGNIIPSANSVYSLGSITNQWKSLFVSNNTIYVGGFPIGIDATGNLTVSGNIIPTIGYVNAQVANVVVDLSAYALNANVTAANVGLKGYVDQANTIQSAQISAANVGMRGYVDTTIAANIANIAVGYSNVNVKAYTETVGFTNYSNVNLSAYLGGAVTIGGNLTVNGNLFINGNSTTINANNLIINDNIIYMANANPANSLDIGFVGHFTATRYQHTGLVRQATSGQWQLFSNVTAEPGATIDFTSAVYDDIRVGNITSPTITGINANVSAANVGIIGYIDLANTIQSAQVGAANLAITTANTAMKGYVDSQTFYSNARVATYLQSGNIANVSVAGNITATYFVGNGALLTGISASSNYSNVNVATYLPTYAGNIANIRLGVSGALTFADGTTQTTAATGGGSSYSNVNVAAYLTINSYLTSTTANLSTYAYASNVTTANTGVVGYIDLANTIQSNQLTAANTAWAANAALQQSLIGNLQASAYSNVNLASYLAGNVTVGTISLTGNVNANNLVGTSANTTITAGTFVSTFNNAGNVILPNVYVSGNVTANYILGNGALLTGIVASGSTYSNVQVATYLPTYSGALQSSNVQTTTANIQSLTASTNNATGALRVMGGVGVGGNVSIKLGQQITVGIEDPSANVAFPERQAIFIANANIASGINVRNFGSGGGASSNYVAVADNNQGDTHYAVFGIAGSGFNAGGPLIAPNDAYLSTIGGNLIINSGASQDIIIAGAAGTVLARFKSTTSNVSITATATSTSTTTGALTVSGGVGVVGNIYAGGNITANTGSYFVGNGALLTGIVASGGNYGNVDVKAFLGTAAGFADGYQRKIEGYYANVILGDTTKLFSFGNSSKSYFGHDGFLGNASINYIRADNADVRIATNNGAYAWIFDRYGNLTLSGNTFSVNYANGTPVTFSSSSYSNVQVATYLPTYSGNVSALNFVGAIQAQVGSSFAYSLNAFGAGQDGGGVFLPADNNSNAIVAGYTIVGNSGAVTLTVTSATVVTGTPNFVSIATTPTASSFAYPVTVYTANYSPALPLSTITVGNATVSGRINFDYLSISSYNNVSAFYAPSGNVQLAAGTGNAQIVTNSLSASKTWTFDNTGLLTFAGTLTNGATFDGNDFTAAPNSFVEFAGYTGNTYVGLDNDSVFIQTNWSTAGKQWTFANTGSLIFPDNTVQTTAYTGGSSYSNVQVATYLPTYSGNIANIRLGNSGVLTFADGTTQTTAGGGGSNYSNSNVSAYLISSNATFIGNTGNVSSVYPLQSNITQVFIGPQTALASGNANVTNTSWVLNNLYFNSIGNLVVRNTQTGYSYMHMGGAAGIMLGGLNSAATANANVGVLAPWATISSTGVTTTGTTTTNGITTTAALAVNSALGITSNQATQLIFNQTVTTITMGTGAATTINLGTTAAPTSNVFVGGTLGTNVYGLTLRANGQFNLVTSLNSSGGYGIATYTGIPVTGGSGNGMIISMTGVASGYLSSASITNPGTGYRSGDAITIPAGNPVGSLGGSFVVQNYHANRSNIGTGIWQLGIDGNLTAPGNISISSGSSYFLGNSVGTTAAYTGNVSANYFVGNGTLLTDLPGYAYGNVNVAAYLNATGYNLYSNVNVKAYTESMGFQNYGNVNVAALITTNGLTNYSNVNVIAYLAGNITVGNIAGSVNGFAIGYRDVPQITVANLTLIASDAGKHYYGSNTNPVTLTIPLNSSVAFGNGTAISIINQGTGNITIANIAGVQLYLAGNATGGSRTLTSYGMATLIKVQVNTWFINGTGVV